MGQHTPELRRQPTSSSSSTTVSSSNSSAANRQSRTRTSTTPKCEIANRSSDESHPSSSFGSTSDKDQADDCRRVKCVLVGDAAVGKTSLIVSYTTDGYPQEYVPTAFDNYTVSVRVDGQPVKVQLCDTAGQDDFDSLRPLCYPNTDVFLLCFSVINPTSFRNISERWIPEIRQYAPEAPFILIGTESDLRTSIKILIDLTRHNRGPISSAEARELALEIGAIRYIECSSLTQLNLKEVFDAAILAALKLPDGNDQTRVQMQDVRGRKSLRKWKEKLVTRSNSADSMKHFRIKRSASSHNNNTAKISNAHSIGRLHFYAASPSYSCSTYDLKRQPTRPSYALALSNAHSVGQNLCNTNLKFGAEKSFLDVNRNSTPGRVIGGVMSKKGNQETDLSKAKKGWKKLLCVV